MPVQTIEESRRQAVKTKMAAIGIGNEFRKDDGIGIFLARRLKEIFPESLQVIEERGEGAKLMESWKGFETVFVFDAVFSLAKAGTIYYFDAGVQKVPRGLFHYSTHAFSVAEAVEVARALGELPACLLVYGIEGEAFDSGTGLSEAVKQAAEKVIKEVKIIIEGMRCHDPCEKK